MDVGAAFGADQETTIAVQPGEGALELPRSKGDEVVRIPRRLTELGCDPGTVDGDFGGVTRYAVRRRDQPPS